MSIVITAGGTAGHINPALAVAAELGKRGKEVVFAGSIGGMEENLVQAAGLEYQAFAAKGFNRQNPLTLLSSSLILAQSTKKARQWLKEKQAGAVGAFGGYVSVPVGRGAAKEAVPLLIHEQNSHMGWSNRYLSKHAQRIALAYEAAAEGIGAQAQKRVRITGNPVRSEFSALGDELLTAKLRSELRTDMALHEDDLVLLVIGGSQGARRINQALVRLAPQLMKRPSLAIIHLTGPKEFQNVEDALITKLGEPLLKRWKLIDYCTRMPAAFAAADIVISRAGASSLAELTVAAKPALLIPYPYATADHQRKNAESLVKAGAAKMVPDAELESPYFSHVLLSFIDNAETRDAMRKAAQNFQGLDATIKVADLLISIYSG